MVPSVDNTRVTIRPKQGVLSHKLLTLGAIALAGFGAYVYFRWRAGDTLYFVETFPVHVLLAGLIGAYLLYLSHALFHSLSTTRKIVCDASGLEVHGHQEVKRFDWTDIEHVRMGDIYLRLHTSSSRIEIPFISRSDQQIIYRFHNERVRFMPDRGRFLAPMPRRR